MLAEAISSPARNDVLAALQQASSATGSDFHYLLCTAMRESSLQPQAKSSSSSACGLFQFVDQTWLGLVKQYGAKHGLGSYAGAIQQHGDGHFEAGNQADRQAILALRNDPRISALMAGEYANSTRASLEATLGRPVSNGELYAAHFLGPDAAARLIRMNETQPQTIAAHAFPQAAGANRSVFYHANGAPKSIREVYEWALRQPSVPQAPAIPAAAQPTPSPAAESRALAPASRSEDWIAMQLWAATQATASALMALDDAPRTNVVDGSSLFDMLRSLSPAGPAIARGSSGGS